jgi:hypothetical protein
MYTKITQAFLQVKSNQWLFRARGQDGSTYEYNTGCGIEMKDERTMFKSLQDLISDGFIKADYWRLV